jgi:hypothetical protein
MPSRSSKPESHDFATIARRRGSNRQIGEPVRAGMGYGESDSHWEGQDGCLIEG